MADRTISVRLQAIVGPYQAQMAKATKDTRDFKREFGSAAKEGSQFTKQLGTGMLVAGGLVAVGFGKMISAGSGFQKEMSGVRAVSGASADEMKQLSDAALEAGASVKLAGVTASDAAKAEAELVKAGVSVSEVLGGALMGSLTLASAGQLDFANAATIAAQAMNIFDLSGSDVTHVADVLAAAANKSAADVGQLGDALRQGGLVASQTGLSLEETTAALAAFADNALVGSDAGTSLKTMLQRLTPQSKEAQQEMDRLGFNAYDAQGKFIGLEGLAGELTTSLSGMTDQQRNASMQILFGSDAVRGANVLYKVGAEGIRDYEAALDDEGAAARMAAIQNDNLSGDIEALGGAIESVMIESAGSASGVMRELTQTITTMVTGVSELQGPLGGVAIGVGSLLGALSLAGGGVLLLAPKIDAAKKALEGMGSAGQFAARNMGKAAVGMGALAAAAGVVTFAMGKMAEARSDAEALADTLVSGMDAPVTSLDDLHGRIIRLNGAMADAKTHGDNAINPLLKERYRELEVQLGITRDSLLAADSAASQLQAELGISADEAARMATNQGLMEAATDPATGVLDAQTAVALDHDQAMKELEESIKGVTDAMRAQFDPFFAMTDALLDNRDAQDDVTDAEHAYNDALVERDRTIRVHGRNSEHAKNAADDLAEAERNLQDAHRGAVRSAIDVSAAAQELKTRMEEQGLSTDEATATMEQWVAQGLITEEQAKQMAVEMGLAGIAAGELGRMDVNVSVRANLGSFYESLREAAAVVDAFNATRGTSINVYRGQGAVPGKALGGPVYKALGGPSGTDTVPAWLTPGEFVMRKSAVDSIGIGALSAMNRGTITPTRPSFAGGGSQTIVVEVPVNLDGRRIGSSRAVIDGMDSRRRIINRNTAA